MFYYNLVIGTNLGDTGIGSEGLESGDAHPLADVFVGGTVGKLGDH